MEQSIEILLRQGFRVVSQTEHGVQLVRPKAFSLFWFLVWTVPSFGTLFWVYLVYYLAKRDSVVFLRPSGPAVRTGTYR